MKLPTTSTLLSLFFAYLTTPVLSYEIPNHADMSQTSAEKSVLQQGDPQKLSRLGLKPRVLIDPLQTFPLSQGLPIKPTCFGVTRNTDGIVVADPNNQPPWGADAGRTQLSIANLFRYGACYEDNVEPGDIRVLAHFYDPQNGGRGLSTLVGPLGPSSPDWVLRPGSGNVATGANHYGWPDARAAFYDALTFNSQVASVSPADNELLRKGKWGVTFQALGHIVHHLQDMAQPQHVRNDDHCDAALCVTPVLNRPSGYEKRMLNQGLEFVRTLAASASAPIMFGLPREFWSLKHEG